MLTNYEIDRPTEGLLLTAFFNILIVVVSQKKRTLFALLLFPSLSPCILMHADSPSLIDWVDRSHRRRLCLKLRPQFPLFFSLSISYIEWAGRLLGTDGDTDRHFRL